MSSEASRPVLSLQGQGLACVHCSSPGVSDNRQDMVVCIKTDIGTGECKHMLALSCSVALKP